jgi:hypothetical protein
MRVPCWHHAHMGIDHGYGAGRFRPGPAHRGWSGMHSGKTQERQAPISCLSVAVVVVIPGYPLLGSFAASGFEPQSARVTSS